MIIHGKIEASILSIWPRCPAIQIHTHTRNITDEYFAEKDREKKRKKEKDGEMYIDASFYK